MSLQLTRPRLTVPSVALFGSSSLRQETTGLFARMTTQPSDTRKALINNLIAALISAGVWPKLDAFYVTAAHASQAALLNWKSTSYNLTATNSPTFATDRGYTGDGATSFLDTAAVRNALANYAQNSASIGAWVRNNVASSTARSIGASTANLARILPRSAGGAAIVYANDTAALTIAGITTSAGLTVANRSGASARQVYKNGASIGSDTQASASLGAETLYLLRDGTNYSTHQIASAFIGASLTAGEHLALYNALNTYLVAIGAA